MNHTHLVKILLFLIFVIVGLCSFAQPAYNNSLTLWYKQPAHVWTEALPIGNGRLGAMIFGKTNREIIQLNEESVWAGSKINNNNPQAATYLPEIQKAIFDNEFAKAKELAEKYMVGTPPRIRSYQPLGNLYIDYGWQQHTNYYRSLDLTTGVHSTSYQHQDNTVSQRVYASAVNDAIIIEIKSEKPISFFLGLMRDQDVYEYGVQKDVAYFNGQIIDQEDKGMGPGGKHMKFNASMKIVSNDGKLKAVKGDTIAGFAVENAKTLLVAITGTTDYNIEKLDVDRSIDPLVLSNKILNKITQSNYKSVFQNHLKEYQSIFSRVQVQLGKDSFLHIPTNERIENMKKGKDDEGLLALFYQYGRYLLMSSSRAPGRLPANLQGIWNKEYAAPWNSDFHTNINLQMNYWPAESGNLPETSLVLANFMKQISIPGGQTAKEMYKARGWTLHHLTDPYGRTGVADGVWGVSPMNGPWMTFPLYERYTFTNDIAYLRNTAYPVLKGSVEWLIDFLVRSPEGYWVTNPSHSPENDFYAETNKGKVRSALSYATTIDIQIIQQLFTYFKEASSLLALDEELRKQVIAVEKELPPVRIAKNGTIQEWIYDYEEVEPGHRHMSHLLGLYPANSIHPQTVDLFQAAKKTIERRLSFGGGHTGWSRAWIINFYARLLDGEKAYQHLRDLVGKTCLPNLYSTHPPFQIDGNFGGAAGVAEMLLQSQNAELHLLPAIPKAWSKGAMKGIKARGGFVVDVEWNDGQITKLKLESPVKKSVKIRFKEQLREVNLVRGENDLTSLFK